MADKPVTIAKDPDKIKMQALARKPIWTPQERDEILRLLIKKAGIADA
ncbi:MAG: hypothetical protein K8I01_09655 [Candidatus Methylomirabilis sp.]|nr:hypothetical protein [Deltaproteobacteria bacterium]